MDLLGYIRVIGLELGLWVWRWEEVDGSGGMKLFLGYYFVI